MAVRRSDGSMFNLRDDNGITTVSPQLVYPVRLTPDADALLAEGSADMLLNVCNELYRLVGEQGELPAPLARFTLHPHAWLAAEWAIAARRFTT